MSISKSLLRAAKIQDKIDELRGQLSKLLDQTRAEIASSPAEELALPTRRGRPKMLKSVRGKRAVESSTSLAPNASQRGKANKRSKPDRGLRASRRSPLAGHKRAASPSGPLAPAVVKVLQSKKQPMKVSDILAGLLAGGYQFNSREPKKNLAARIYRLKGVKQISSGLFGLV